MGEYHGRVSGGQGMRLDRYIAARGSLSRSQLKARDARALVNGAPAKWSLALKDGDTLDVFWEDAPPMSLIAEDLPLEVIYEDRRVIVVNKARGMVVHPGAGNWSGTLVNALLGRQAARGAAAEDWAGARPFIAHRLDKDTSGALIAAWDSEALAFLQEQFKARTVKKRYIALTRGAPPEERGRISARIARSSRERTRFTVSRTRGKSALTRYRVKERYVLPGGAEYALLFLYPATGRTHQLRVHLRSLGCPIVGDPLYGTRDRHFPGASLALHARSLSLVLPGEDAPSVFLAPLPSPLRRLIAGLRQRQRRV
jgi:23S rRNA pseudouridine1911/1915/1917 synthase